MKRRIFFPIVLLVIIAAAAWYIYGQAEPDGSTNLQASGTVEGVQVTVAAETGGRVVEVLVNEGDSVQPGDVLFRLDDAVLQGQRLVAQAAVDSANSALETSRNGQDLAQAALDIANANIKTARAAQETAELQADSILATALQAEQAANQRQWQIPQPSEFNQPAWYFQRSEELDAARVELEIAQQDLNEAQGDLTGLLNSDSGKELSKAEGNLNQKRIAFEVAQEVLNRAGAQTDQKILDAAQEMYDAAKEALDTAQTEYERLFTGDFVDTVMNARAKVSVAQQAREIAQDRVTRLQTGFEALPVKTAQSAARQAEAATAVAEANAAQAETALEAARLKVDQASKAVDQAQAGMDLIDIQIAKLEVKALVAGVITSRSVEPGEVLTPGGAAMIIGELDRLTITVYLPEDRYGSVGVGSQATVTVDSFPDQTFLATVVRIADQAEFTPRNVSTQEGRTTTVFSVELKVDNPERMLKPGMPADVSFVQ